MKIYYEYQKEVGEWIKDTEEIPSRFNSSISMNQVNPTYEVLRDTWVSNRMKYFNTHTENYKNVVVNLQNNVISYDYLSENYEDDVEILEIETVKDLVAAMNNRECTMFVKDEEHKNRWIITF